MAQVDIFILLCHCQWEKGGYQNRCNLDGNWYTMPVHQGISGPGGRIIDKQYINPLSAWSKIRTKLSRYDHILNQLDSCICDSLADTNEVIIRRLAHMAGIKTNIIRDVDTDLQGTSRLIDLVLRAGGTTYLSGPSGKDYLDCSAFYRQRLEVQFFENKDKRHTLDVLYDCHPII